MTPMSGGERDQPELLEAHSKIVRDLLLGFVKTHLLHHASRGPVYGAGLMDELERHGYQLSPGTLYPLLHGLEAAEFLRRDDRVVDGKVRKYYRITRLGERALDDVRGRMAGLLDEIAPDADGLSAARSGS
jgi:PadR family transcriptional regulator PadR